MQSIVSLRSLLRGQLIKCFTTLLPSTLKFFVEKMREASHNFSTKNFQEFQLLTFEILTLTDDSVSFEQLGRVVQN